MTRLWKVAGKAITGAAGTLGTLVAAGVLPDPWDKVAGALLVIATTVGIYHAPYQSTKTPPAP